jgi:GLPGLI family protein
MKRILILTGVLVSMAAAHIVFGQTSEGVITFETKVNLHRRLPPGEEARKAMIPEFRTTKQQLFFTDTESLYKPLIEDEDETSASGGMQMTIRVPNNETYINGSNEMISKNEFFGKDYLVLDTLKVSPWKFGPETREIQGYACKQAFYTDETIPDRKQEITAWYSEKIRPMLGPERFGSLPGGVLAVDINNGERVVVARKIESRPLKKNEIKAPSSGQKMTAKEYRKMVDEQMKKMGGSGGFIIRN